MARTRVAKLAFNRGIVSRLGLARADIKRLAMAAEVQINWMPRVLGSMSLRPGLGYIGAQHLNAKAKYMPFVFSTSDKALLELTANVMRVWIDDALLTRVAVSTAVVNGGFDANLNDWVDDDEAGGSSAWIAGGYMGLTSNGSARAMRYQIIAPAVADLNVEHALRIVVARGPVTVRVGDSFTNGDEYVTETELATGTHSLAFTPSSSFLVRFTSSHKRTVLIDSISVEAAGVVTVPTPWALADLENVRFDQSGDIVFVSCVGYTQRKIERRATRSWSVVQYLPIDGPFRVENVGPITITPTGLSGNITLNSSAPLFRSTHAPSANNAGALFQITSNGQTVSASITAQNQFTNAIRVTGVEAGRVFTLTIDEDGAGSATFTLQRSLDSDEGPWNDVLQRSADTTETYDDTLTNQIAWYRIGVKTGDYGSGTHAVSLNYTSGAIDGVVRVVEFTSSTSVAAEVITDLGGTSATDFWAEGSWSNFRGWPSAVAFFEGRLWWAGKDKIDGSISDAFDSFAPTFEGDAGPIARTIGRGPVDTINWLIGLQRMLIGGQSTEYSCRSSSLDEPLTPTNFNLKNASTQGSAPVQALPIDSRGVFVQRGGTRVYELAFDNESFDYGSSHLSALCPEIGQPGIVRMAVQRQPDTRVHFIRSDGTAAVLVFDKVEQVVCWLEVETDGEIEDVCVLPAQQGEEEDIVYYSVKRTINGATVRYLERWALESDCRGGTLCKLADSFVIYTGVATTTITAAHLAGENVVVWADGADVGTAADGSQTYTLDASGRATLAAAATNYVIGLPYEAPYKSAKLVELMEQAGGSLTDVQQIKGLALILADVHAKGLKFGQTLEEDDMDPLPEVEAGAIVAPNAVRADYATEPITFPGEWSTDARLCLLAKAPRPCTVLAAIAELEHHR